jgi:hypothetical protein
MVVLRKDDTGGPKLILIGKVTSVRLDVPGDGRLEAFDAVDKSLGPAEAKREGNTLSFTPSSQVDYYRLAPEPR